MNTADLIAIDTHTHLEVSCRNPFDNYGEEFDRAADKYFRTAKRPTMDETIAFYRRNGGGDRFPLHGLVIKQQADAADRLVAAQGHGFLRRWPSGGRDPVDKVYRGQHLRRHGR